MPNNKQIFTEIIRLMNEDSNHIAKIKKVIRNYVSCGFNINTRYIKGRNLGHYVVKYNITSLISFLAHLGLNLNICDDFYDTPIHYAVKLNRYQICKELINNHVDINMPSEFEETPLHIAVSENNLEIATLLIKSGVDTSLVDEHNHTAIDYAIDENNQKMIELLTNKQNRKKGINQNE